MKGGKQNISNVQETYNKLRKPKKLTTREKDLLKQQKAATTIQRHIRGERNRKKAKAKGKRNTATNSNTKKEPKIPHKHQLAIKKYLENRRFETKNSNNSWICFNLQTGFICNSSWYRSKSTSNA